MVPLVFTHFFLSHLETFFSSVFLPLSTHRWQISASVCSSLDSLEWTAKRREKHSEFEERDTHMYSLEREREREKKEVNAVSWENKQRVDEQEAFYCWWCWVLLWLVAFCFRFFCGLRDDETHSHKKCSKKNTRYPLLPTCKWCVFYSYKSVPVPKVTIALIHAYFCISLSCVILDATTTTVALNSPYFFNYRWQSLQLKELAHLLTSLSLSRQA